MSFLLLLAARSAWNRRLTLGMTLIAVALSVTLLLGVERVRQGARNGFAQSVAGTDLVVGARTSPVQLMLYAIFRIGDATHNIGWQSYRRIAENPAVAWSIPLVAGRFASRLSGHRHHQRLLRALRLRRLAGIDDGRGQAVCRTVRRRPRRRSRASGSLTASATRSSSVTAWAT
jgi:hypothetical protein